MFLSFGIRRYKFNCLLKNDENLMKGISTGVDDLFINDNNCNYYNDNYLNHNNKKVDTSIRSIITLII